MSKQAVIFLLDSSKSMETAYPKDEPEKTTRFSVAKEACENMICELMLQRKDNECAVYIIKSSKTRHEATNYDDVVQNCADFPNIYQISNKVGIPEDYPAEGLSRPSVDLVRNLREVQCGEMVETRNSNNRGNLLHGLYIAVDAMQRRKNKFRRRIVLFTDAEHCTKSPVDLLNDEDDSDNNNSTEDNNAFQPPPRNVILGHIVEQLRTLECSLTVVGLDFVKSWSQAEQLAEETVLSIVKQEEEKEDHNHGLVNIDKLQNEQVLIDLVNYTTGEVVAATSIRHILESSKGRRIPLSTKFKCTMKIADLEIKVRFSIYISKESVKTTKKEAWLHQKKMTPNDNSQSCVSENHDKNVSDNNTSNSSEVTAKSAVKSNIKKIAKLFDEDDEEMKKEVPMENRVEAYRFGTSFVTYDDYVKKGLKFESPVMLTLVGFVPKSEVSVYHFSGNAYILSADDTSTRSHEIFTALSICLNDLDQVAVFKFVKRKDSDPLLAACFPHCVGGNEDASPASTMLMIPIPFQDDYPSVRKPLSSKAESSKAQLCDDLIESMMFPADDNTCMDSSTIGNPAIRCLNRLMMARAIAPSDTSIPPVRTRKFDDDPMLPSSKVVSGSEPKIKAFCAAFPCKNIKDEPAKSINRPGQKRRRNSQKSYSYYLMNT